MIKHRGIGEAAGFFERYPPEALKKPECRLTPQLLDECCNLFCPVGLHDPAAFLIGLRIATSRLAWREGERQLL